MAREATSEGGAGGVIGGAETRMLPGAAWGSAVPATSQVIGSVGLGLQRKPTHRAVLDAYGWPQDLSDEEILEQMLAWNLERAG